MTHNPEDNPGLAAGRRILAENLTIVLKQCTPHAEDCCNLFKRFGVHAPSRDALKLAIFDVIDVLDDLVDVLTYLQGEERKDA